MIPARLSRRGSAFDQGLLAAAREERPTDGAEERALATLGLSIAAPPSPIASPTNVGPPSPAASSKWLGATAGAVGLGLVTLALLQASPKTSPLPGPPRTGVALETSAPAPSPVVAPSVTLSPVPVPVPVPVAVASARPAPRRPLRRVPATPPPDSSAPPDTPSPGLSSELELVQGAARALAAHEPETALALTTTYATQYPRGVLGTEAGYVRAQALLAHGQRADAIALAEHLLAADPRGVLAPKLKALVSSDTIP